jgi:carbon storage regulator
MLVLGRKVNESVVIGDEIVVTVLAVEGDRVKIGIDAPSHVRILRQELYELVKEVNLQAANISQETSEDVLSSVRDVLQMRKK